MAENIDGFLARIKKQEADAYLQTGNIEQARSRCVEACRLNPSDPRARLTLGNIDTRLGRTDEAEQAYRKAIELDPQLGEAHQFLGNLLGAQGRYEEAAACYRRGLQIKPESIPAHINLGTALVLQGKLEEARQIYENALRLDPQCRKAALGIAQVHERQGNVEQAYSYLQPFLEAGDANIDVAMIFAALSRPLGRCDEAIALLEGLLENQRAPLETEQSMAAHFRLGRLYDANGDYDAAFAHFSQANEAKVRKWAFDTEAHAGYVTSLIETFTPQFLARAPRPAQPSRRPVFIVGMPRSGTSLVEHILASHPAVHGAGELDEMQHIAGELPRTLGSQSPYPQCLQEMTQAQCEGLAQRYLDHLSGLAPAEALRVTDKMPGNFIHLGLIALLFPEARIIHCVRDPLDTCLSCYFQNFTPANAYTFHLPHLGAYYREYRRLMDHWRSVLDVPLLEVRYEDLVADQENVSRALVEFCGLEWDERCLRFYEHTRAVATASYEQVRQPIYRRSLQRWRNYASHLAPLREALGAVLDVENDGAGPAGAADSAADASETTREARALLAAADPAGARAVLARGRENDPEDAQLCSLLATAELRLGNPQAALEHCREALRLEPRDMTTWNDLGSTFTALDQSDEAARCFEASLKAAPNAFAHFHLGNIYTDRRWLEQAVSHYRQALVLEPGRPDVYNNLGVALRHLGQYDQAQAAFGEVLRIAPDHPRAHEAYTNRGTVLLILNRLEKARKCFQQALALHPGMPRALAGEANVLQRERAFEQAYELVEPALRSGEADANIALVLAAMCRPLGRCAEAAALMQRLLAGDGPAVDNDQRGMLHFALGRLLDGNAEYEKAFEHFRHGNELALHHFDAQAHERFTDAISQTYSDRFLAQAPRSGIPSDRLIFIVGMPRSGTSLVEQILASHPAVFGAGELEELQRISVDAPSVLSNQQPYPQCMQGVSLMHCEGLARRYLDYIDKLAPPGAQRVTDKMPGNFLHLGLISLLFPQARIIHCVRDPLDTCLSCYFQDFITIPYSYDLAHLGAYYRQYRRLMEHWRSVLDMPMLEVRYEDLVADQENVSRALVDFCGLEWEERCLRFHETRRAVATASYDQVRQPIYDRSVGRWRHYAQHLGPLQQALEER